jgi:4-hydroxybenzoate polyprenyltransferase
MEIIKLLRPHQWLKNMILFAGLIFSLHFRDPQYIIQAVYGFIIFCLLSSASYVFNDILDRERDRQHPIKKDRPIASGKVSVGSGVIIGIILAVISLAWAYFEGLEFFLAALSYFILVMVYSLKLKEIVIVDVLSVALGFVIRAAAGVLILHPLSTDIVLSPWLVICTILLALFIILGKRRHELLLLENGSGNHRPVLQEYTPALLDMMISIVTACVLLSYILYTMSDRTFEELGTNKMIYTVPFVLYGIFRYMYLIYSKNKGGSPEKLLVEDMPLIIDVFLWVLATIIIVLYKL